jgi:hypothetical protein
MKTQNSESNLTIQELEKRMRPGAYSIGGFLGPDESLEAVIERDNHALDMLGVAHQQVALALEQVLQSVNEMRDRLFKENSAEYWRREWGWESYFPELFYSTTMEKFSTDKLPAMELGYLVGANLQVFLLQSKGLQECPWDCEYEDWSSFEFLILNRESGNYVVGPGLIVHLIQVHHFFEGLESPYRVDPAKVIQVLEITSTEK